jgi:AraC family transcriptional regulator
MGSISRSGNALGRSRRQVRIRWQSAVELSSTPPGRRPAQTDVFSAKGIDAHHVTVNGIGGYDFRWKGRSHYLALHDLSHVASETYTDAHTVNRCIDLRGNLTYIPAGCRVWGWAVPHIRKQSFTALYFDPVEMEAEVAERLRRLPECPMLYFANLALRATFEKLQRALNAPIPSDRLYLESLCLVALLEICIVQQERVPVDAHRGHQVLGRAEERVIEFININLADDISLSDLAQIAGLSRFHFIKAFKHATSKTPYQYLIERRIDSARSLLERGDLSIGDVAAAVGFKDPSRFSRVFRRFTGATPRRYRELLQ